MKCGDEAVNEKYRATFFGGKGEAEDEKVVLKFFFFITSYDTSLGLPSHSAYVAACPACVDFLRDFSLSGAICDKNGKS